MDNKEYFNKALSNFIYDNASGGAIRHLFDIGYTVDEISKTLTYPTPYSKIQEIVWNHMLNKGIISLSNPQDRNNHIETEFVEEYDEFGRKHFRRVSRSLDISSQKYMECSFGKELYKNKEEFLKRLDVLNDKDREYLLGIPWPLKTVYHIMDDRMSRISQLLQL